MKITDVKATTLKGYKQWNYVLIETDAGLTGLGEAHPGSGVSDIAKQFNLNFVQTCCI
jgi:gluconate/galactonate dehydratase